MTPRYHVIAHHVSHLFPDLVSGPMTENQANDAAAAIPGDLPPGARGWTTRVERVGAGNRPHHIYPGRMMHDAEIRRAGHAHPPRN